LPNTRGRYNPFLSECVSFKIKKTRSVIMRMIANAAPAIMVKSVRLISLREIEEKIKQGAAI
jgi:hypothetical protein